MYLLLDHDKQAFASLKHSFHLLPAGSEERGVLGVILPPLCFLYYYSFNDKSARFHSTVVGINLFFLLKSHAKPFHQLSIMYNT